MCISLKTGEIVWERERTEGTRGRAAVVYADGHLYLRHSAGAVTLVEATPSAYVEKGTFTIPDHEPSRGATFPVIAGGRLFLRDNNRLFCYDVREDALKTPRPDPQSIALSIPSAEAQEKDRIGLRSVFVPTPQDVVEKMLELAGVGEKDLVYDLGSGDGRIVIAAAKRYGCRAVGYEIDRELVELSRENVGKAGVERLVTIEQKDVFTVDLSKADVIAVYLLPKQLEKLVPQLEKLKPGSRIVSHQFEIPGVKPDKQVRIESNEDGDDHSLYLWTAPLKKP
jgi:protein-L-isoaspartate O-methyltransferase